MAIRLPVNLCSTVRDRCSLRSDSIAQVIRLRYVPTESDPYALDEPGRSMALRENECGRAASKL
jgi:hypothetical protein